MADLAIGDEQRFRGQGMINRDREWRIESPGRLPSIRSQSQATAASQARHGMRPEAGIEVTDDEHGFLNGGNPIMDGGKLLITTSSIEAADRWQRMGAEKSQVATSVLD